MWQTFSCSWSTKSSIIGNPDSLRQESRMRIEQGWLKEARQVVSPNHDERPQGEVSAVVLHSISLPPGEFGGEHIERLFTNRLNAAAHPCFAGIAQLRVSAHLLIRREIGRASCRERGYMTVEAGSVEQNDSMNRR